jgi:gliding motility-associated-like protein
MLNGTGLLGGVTLSSTTAAVIVPKPGSSNLYYIVTVNEGSSGSGIGGIAYSVVNMSLEGGLGAVEIGQKNIFLFQTNTEKLEVVPAANGTDYWIVTHESSNFVSFQVSSSGIQTTPVQSLVSGDLSNSSGHLKVNSQFNILATGSTFEFKMRLFNFNNATGVVSDRLSIPFNATILGNSPLIYGVEFSPNGRFLYFSNLNSLFQYDINLLTQAEIEGSAYLVDIGGQPATVQIGPDRKIYINNGSLSVINCPDKPGNSCGYENTSLQGGGYGLPKWVYYANDPPLPTTNSIVKNGNCQGLPISFSLQNTSNIVSVSWNFGDPASGTINNTSSSLTPQHTYNTAGSYTVNVVINYTCSTETISLPITINSPVVPTFNPIPPLCVGDSAPVLPITSLNGIAGTWNPTTVSTSSPGTSTYTFTPNAGQCANTENLVVSVQNTIDFEITGSCVSNNFILEVTPLNNTFDINTANFDWLTSNQQSVGNDSNTFNVTQYLNSTTIVEELPITFSVTVTPANGCPRNEPYEVQKIVCTIQKGISVNNDGANEFFDLSSLNVNILNIYNRYGTKVYSKGQYKNEWIGQSNNGDILPDGTYFYEIEFNNGDAAKTGWIYKISNN